MNRSAASLSIVRRDKSKEDWIEEFVEDQNKDKESSLSILQVAKVVSALVGLYTVKYLCNERSNRKRKRIGPCERTESKKKMKVLTSETIADAEIIADAMSRIASACEAAVNSLVVPGTSIGEVMAELQHMEAITSDLDWHSRCCQLMMFKSARETFVALKGHEQKLLNWLKYAAYNPSPRKKT